MATDESVNNRKRRFLLGALKGEGLLFARGGRWPIKIEASPAEHRLATTNPRELLDAAEGSSRRAPLAGAASGPAGARASVGAGRS